MPVKVYGPREENMANFREENVHEEGVDFAIDVNGRLSVIHSDGDAMAMYNVGEWSSVVIEPRVIVVEAGTEGEKES